MTVTVPERLEPLSRRPSTEDAGDASPDPKGLDAYAELMTYREVRDYLRIGKTSLWRMIQDGELDVRRPRPRSPRIVRDSVRNYLRRRRD